MVLQTLSSVAFGGAAATAWAFGDSDLSDGVADFPLLTVHDLPLQAVNLARALTRILGVGDAATVHLTRRTRFLGASDLASFNAALAAGTTVTTDGIRLDTNGLAADRAADDGTAGTSIPSCSFEGGVLRAQTNYNGVTVELSMLTSEGANLSISADPTACEAIIEKADKEFAATLRLEISAPADVRRRPRAHFDDGLRFAHRAAVAPPPVINAPAGAVVVAADAGAASVTTFVLESGEGTFASVTQGNLRTGGGDEAAVTLAAVAVAAFASDNLTLSLTLTATGGRFGYGDDSIYFRAASEKQRRFVR